MISLNYLFEQDTYGVRPDMIKRIAPRIPVETLSKSQHSDDNKKPVKMSKPVKITSLTLMGKKYNPPKPFKPDVHAVGSMPGKPSGG